DIVQFIGSYVEKGIRYVISTDINVDGTLNGPSIELYKNILTAFPDIYLIASGGVSGITDIERLDTISVPAVIVGKAIYEGRITLKEIEKMNLN
ncbi:HisA/HisF-related TIM barrel protein, partial [uncultured Muribaculum sp.]|uniref:HisA/HisF-related TIM barrel protein n=1 Tax=uncultured Muribaculum sp. TaxID=1918613 RepID=UPI0025B66155